MFKSLRNGYNDESSDGLRSPPLDVAVGQNAAARQSLLRAFIEVISAYEATSTEPSYRLFVANYRGLGPIMRPSRPINRRF